jgi:ribosome maturation factor RimP
MASSIKEKVIDLVSAPGFLEGEDIFLVEVIVQERKERARIIVVLDGDSGINIDRCAQASRKLGEALEAEDLVGVPYLLEVSSPGVEQPLKLHRQYLANVGRTLRVELADGSTQQGKLATVTEDGVVLETAPKKKKKTDAASSEADPEGIVPFADIKSAKVIVVLGQEKPGKAAIK